MQNLLWSLCMFSIHCTVSFLFDLIDYLSYIYHQTFILEHHICCIRAERIIINFRRLYSSLLTSICLSIYSFLNSSYSFLLTSLCLSIYSLLNSSTYSSFHRFISVSRFWRIIYVFLNLLRCMLKV